MRKQRRRSAFTVTAKLISAFVFTTRIVQFLFYLNLKFQVTSHLLWLYSLVCVRPGWKPRRPVFSQRGSYVVEYIWLKIQKTSFLLMRLKLNSHVYYTPRKLCLWEGILFSRCPSVCPSERTNKRTNESVSVTFCFLNILKSH